MEITTSDQKKMSDSRGPGSFHVEQGLGRPGSFHVEQDLGTALIQRPEIDFQSKGLAPVPTVIEDEGTLHDSEKESPKITHAQVGVLGTSPRDSRNPTRDSRVEQPCCICLDDTGRARAAQTGRLFQNIVLMISTCFYDMSRRVATYFYIFYRNYFID